MKYCFLGTSYAAKTLKEGARRRGLKITEDIQEASLIFVSEDTPTDETGKRDYQPILQLIASTDLTSVPLVLTSQVHPGFTRDKCTYHQAETLRIEDGLQRAMYPEMFIVGTNSGAEKIHREYLEYLEAFDCPIIQMTFEEAEFCKMAINAFLISQVETTNMLSEHAKKVGADWKNIAKALRHDSRIGKYAYLTPGYWQDSKHLFRDYKSLRDIFPNDVLLKAWRWE